MEVPMRVRVWRNLRYDCWTVYCCATRRVLGPEDVVLLRDCTFHVSKKGRKRSLKNRWDSRHAYAEGIMMGILDLRKAPYFRAAGDIMPVCTVYNAKKGAFINYRKEAVSQAWVALFPQSESTIYSMGVG
jgi:hypothetical protein